MAGKHGGSQFAKWLRRERKKRGLSQAELAKKTGLHQASICGWERGNTQPRAASRKAIEDFFAGASPAKFGEWLREQRKEQGLSQTDVGKELGVSASTVSHWEKGHAEPSEERKERLRQFLAGDEPQNVIGDWLREQRTNRDWSQGQVAEKAGLSVAAISKIETGKIQNPSDKTLSKLQSVFGPLSPDERESAEKAATVEGLGKFTDFDPHDDDDVPTVPGIYVFYDISERPIYVGQGQDIGKRIRDHDEKFWFKSPIVESGSYIEVKPKKLRRQIESILIRFLKSNAVINKREVQRE